MPRSVDKRNSRTTSPPRTVEAKDQVIDVAASLKRMGNNRDLFCEVVGIYDEDSPQLVARIRDAVHERDAARLHRAAHGLKGLVSNFGANAAAEAAYVLESMGAAGELTGDKEALHVLERELERLTEALRPFAPARNGVSKG
jgi:two-component system, sensor histidine kinase and response regulator